MTSFTDRMIGAARLDPQIYEEVEADQTAMGQAMAVVVIAGVAAGIGAAGGGLGAGVVGGLAALVGFLMVLTFLFSSGAIFQYRFLTNGYGLPVLGTLLALAIGGAKLPWSVKR